MRVNVRYRTVQLSSGWYRVD